MASKEILISELSIDAQAEYEGLKVITKLLKRKLRELGILQFKNLIFCGIKQPQTHRENLLSSGISGGKNSTYGLRIDEFDEDEPGSDPFGFADHGQGALLVYDGTKLVGRWEPGERRKLYYPIDTSSFREALLAIIEIHYTGE